MYKVLKRYYGELNDTTYKDYEEDEIEIVENINELKRVIKDTIIDCIRDYFVVDEENEYETNRTDFYKRVDTLKNNEEIDVILFTDYQENWNSYIEIVIKKCCRITNKYLLRDEKQNYYNVILFDENVGIDDIINVIKNSIKNKSGYIDIETVTDNLKKQFKVRDTMLFDYMIDNTIDIQDDYLL